MDFALLNEGYSVKKIHSFINGSEAPSSTFILYKERRKNTGKRVGTKAKQTIIFDLLIPERRQSFWQNKEHLS